MDAETLRQALAWILAVALLGFLGIAVVIALLAAWRNYNHRQRLIDQGKRLRREFSGQTETPADAWSESGRRFQNTGQMNETDQTDEPSIDTEPDTDTHTDTDPDTDTGNESSDDDTDRPPRPPQR